MFQIGRRSARKSIVRKNRSSADHHAVFDRYPVANVDGRIDLDPISNDDAIGNQSLPAHNALLAELRAVTNVDVVPDRGALAEFDSFFDDRGWVNSNTQGRLQGLSGF